MDLDEDTTPERHSKRNQLKLLVITELSCRCCLKICTQKDSDASDEAKRFQLSTGFEISDQDIPKKICRKCVNDLTHVRRFQNRCRRTQAKLAELATIPTQEPDSLVEIGDLLGSEIKVEPVEYRDHSPEIPPSTKKSRKREATTEHSPENFCCEQCGMVLRMTSYKQHLARHLNNDLSGERYFCDLCLQNGRTHPGFACKERIRDHMKGCHIRSQKLRPCEHCGKVYNTWAKWKRHVTVNHGPPEDLKHACAMCPKRFFTKAKLTIHQRSHTGH